MKKIAADRNYELAKEANYPGGSCYFITFDISRNLKAAAERLKKFNILTLDAIGTWDILENEIIPAVTKASEHIHDPDASSGCMLRRHCKTWQT